MRKSVRARSGQSWGQGEAQSWAEGQSKGEGKGSGGGFNASLDRPVGKLAGNPKVDEPSDAGRLQQVGHGGGAGCAAGAGRVWEGVGGCGRVWEVGIGCKACSGCAAGGLGRVQRTRHGAEAAEAATGAEGGGPGRSLAASAMRALTAPLPNRPRGAVVSAECSTGCSKGS